MKRFLMLSVVFVGTLGFMFNQYAKASGTYYGWQVRSETYNYCSNGYMERHWTVDFNGAGCWNYGNPKYSGSTVTWGSWRDNNSWQLQKRPWMVPHGCISLSTYCWQTMQGCPASWFSSTCDY